MSLLPQLGRWLRRVLEAIPVRHLPPVPALLLVGLALSVVLALRSQVGGDQLNMLARGWLFTQGQWVHIGMTTSANGKAPGGALSVLAGLPLLLWRDHRAVALMVAAAHLLAFFVLDRLLRRTGGETERRLFALVYWLGPWRLLYSAHVWNANLLPVFAALHLATSFAMRHQRRLTITALHVLALGVCAQIHASAAMLVLLSALLVLTRTVRVHWGGAAIGAALLAASLIPWVEEVVANPHLLPAGKGFPLRGLLLVFPLLRGVLMWVRLPSLFITSRMQRYDFAGLVGEPANGLFVPLATAVAWFIGLASLVLPVWALAWLVWRGRRLGWRPAGALGNRPWLLRYLQLTFAASLLAFAASPTTPMIWQGFVLLPAAALLLVQWGSVVARAGWDLFLPRVAALWLAGALLLTCLAAAGAPMYRRGGRHPVTAVLAHDHPMLHDLNIVATTSVRVGEDGSFTPDVFLPNPAEGR